MVLHPVITIASLWCSISIRHICICLAHASQEGCRSQLIACITVPAGHLNLLHVPAKHVLYGHGHDCASHAAGCHCAMIALELHVMHRGCDMVNDCQQMHVI